MFLIACLGWFGFGLEFSLGGFVWLLVVVVLLVDLEWACLSIGLI